MYRLLLCVVLFATRFLCYESTQFSTVFDYAVQVHPVIFLTHPQSQVAQANETVILTCQARMAQIVDKSTPLPKISWRRDGEAFDGLLISDDCIGCSKLVIHNASVSDAGQYQCIVDDANGRYVTVSQPAFLTVLRAGPAQRIAVGLHRPLLLNCSAPLDSTNIKWTFNGSTTVSSSEGVWILSNGSLFIASFKSNNKGTWSCSTQLNNGNHFAVISEYSIESTTDTDFYRSNSSKFAFIFSNVTYPTLGDSLSLLCLFDFNTTSQQVIWLFNNDIISSQSTNKLVINSANYSHNGLYMCQVTSIEGTVSNSSTYSLFVDLPLSLFNQLEAVDLYVTHNNPSLQLNCPSLAGFGITWYKNGVSYSHDNPLNLALNVFGTYQCFYGNKQLSLTRILVKDLANPVGDLSLKPQITSLSTVIGFNVSWTPPIQRGGANGLVYMVILSYFDDLYGLITSSAISDDGKNYYNMKILSSHIIDTIYQTYEINVQVRRGGVIGKSSSTICYDTRVPYFLRVNSPLFYLENDNENDTFVRWDSPSPLPLEYPINHLFLNITCLHGNVVYSKRFYDEYFSKGSYEDSIRFLPHGTVCQLVGKYKLFPSTCPDQAHLFDGYMTIPTTSFQVPFETMEIENSSPLSLYVSTGSNNVTLFWEMENEQFCLLTDEGEALLNTSGVCYHGDSVIKINETGTNMTSLFGVVDTFSNIPNSSICTFFISIEGTNISSFPVSFIMGKEIPEVYSFTSYSLLREPPRCHTGGGNILLSSMVILDNESITKTDTPSSFLQTTSIPTTNTTTSTPTTNIDVSLSPNRDEQSNEIIIVASIFGAVITLLVLVLILLVITVVVVRQQKRKRIMFKIDDSDPYSIINWDDDQYNPLDNISIKTEFNSPYYNELDPPSFSTKSDMSISLDDFFDLMNETVHSIHHSINKSTTSLTDVTEILDAPSAPPPTETGNNEREEVNLGGENKCKECSATIVDVRVGGNGFTFQVDVPRPLKDTSGCSSGYGSDATSSPFENYHMSLEPDLVEVEENKFGAKSEVMTCDHVTCGGDSICCHRSLARKGSCPNLFAECNRDSLFRNRMTTDDTFVVSGNRKSIIRKSSFINQSAESILESCDSCSDDSLSNEKGAYLNMNNPMIKDRLLYVDEKGYIHFICNKEQLNKCVNS